MLRKRIILATAILALPTYALAQVQSGLQSGAPQSGVQSGLQSGAPKVACKVARPRAVPERRAKRPGCAG